jgi:hypothetical protein
LNRAWWRLAACASLFVAAGCGNEPDPPVDPNEAGAALRTALDAWKAGEPFGSLQQRTPPVYFNERDWEAGKKLVNYQLGPVELMGRQGRCTVKLTVRDKDGKQADRDVGYLIDTTPRVVITREGLGP